MARPAYLLPRSSYRLELGLDVKGWLEMNFKKRSVMISNVPFHMPNGGTTALALNTLMRVNVLFDQTLLSM